METRNVNILTLKWGTLYSSEYVNRVYRGVKAHLNARYPEWPGIYVKLLVFRPGFANLEGPTLFLDIDCIQ